jgi:hypothetical protein
MSSHSNRRWSQSARLCLPIACLGAASCSSDVMPTGSDTIARVTSPDVGGCACPGSGGCSALSYGDIPANNIYYITTFGGGTDTQTMSCGGSADGTWAYIADRERFGCGAKVKVEANGKSCVAEVADCGPNKCVEEAACYCSCNGHFPIIDASPFITKYLFNSSSAGWSDKTQVTAVQVGDGSTVGCPGKSTGGGAGAGGSSGSGGVGGAGGSSGEGGSNPEGGGSGEGGTSAGGAGGDPGVGGSAGEGYGGGPGGAGGTEEYGGEGGSAGCFPGQKRACKCEGGGQGEHVCNDDGTAFGDCTGCKIAATSSGNQGACSCGLATADQGGAWLAGVLTALVGLLRRRRQD